MSEILLIVGLIYLAIRMGRMEQAASSLGGSLRAFKAGLEGEDEAPSDRPVREIKSIPEGPKP